MDWIETKNSCTGSFFVLIRGRIKTLDDLFMITEVYGPCDGSLLIVFLEELWGIRDDWSGPWCLVGDFNEILNPTNRNGGSRIFMRNMLTFSNFVDSLALRELTISRTNFTWSNMQESPCQSKLDRFFLSTEWDLLFPLANGESMPRPTSNYIPILLNGERLSSNPKPFKFANIWIKFPSFVDLVKVWWSSYHVTSKPGQQMRLKLKMLREILKC